MSDNSEKEIGMSYSLFASTDGEVFSGGGGRPRDEFVDWLAEEFAECVKGLTDENPHRTIILSLETEPSMDSRAGWVYHVEKYHPLSPIMVRLGSIFNNVAQWLWEKSRTGKWEKTTLPTAPWEEE